MFDVGFSEMMVIAVVALIVIGPERLPKVARTLGHLWGRAQRYINGVKADISRDMALDELKQLREKVQQEADSVVQATRSVSQNIDQQVRSLNSDVAQVANADLPKKIAAPEQQKLPIN
jgi:sec-independent protein translocase protein TatB